MPGKSPLSMMRPPQQRARRPYTPQARGRRRWPILVPVAAVIVLAILWTGLWYYSASRADKTLAGWVQREAAAGRVYSCGTQSIGGFPLGIHAHCADASAEIKTSEPPYAIAAKDIDFVAEVYDPTRLIGDVTGPVTLAALGQSPSLTADWTRARTIVSEKYRPIPIGFLLSSARRTSSALAAARQYSRPSTWTCAAASLQVRRRTIP